jgi:hemolysin III
MDWCSVAVIESPSPTPPPGYLYDSVRNLIYIKPVLRGWLHLVSFQVSLVVGTLLAAATHGAVRTVSVAIYVGCVSGLFGISALYHRGNWSPSASRVLQRLDHMMIFFMIAGTATPSFLIAVPGGFGIAGVAVVWSLTVLALVAHLTWMQAPETLVGATFIALGCVAGLALPAVWISGGVAAGVLMLTGGLLYIVGAVSYHRRSPDPVPAVFGYHEVFHAYVSAAAACQFVAVALLAW